MWTRDYPGPAGANRPPEVGEGFLAVLQVETRDGMETESYEISMQQERRRGGSCCKGLVQTGATKAGRTGDSAWRRGWDSNPRSLSGQRFSRPSDSAALAPLRARSGKDVQLTVERYEIQMKS